ncbi:ABC transporter substrate-binding protein [Pseudactinotalea suaedae]|uniref:ABC transporter substrate-binding protein n=1 Tax=Pseudactinotalea suaedae TaxID=1524924 RepID=UPI0012E186C2|nr:NrtA/SsuA/CpmA family ABC transporter substrate-binding protein [Pseudactinotalea suaedae]
MRTRPLIALAATAATVLTLAACNNDAESGGGSSEDGGAIDLPNVATVVSYPALPSGLELGLFDEPFGQDASGMTVEFVSSGADGVSALASGNVDLVIGGYDPPAMLGATNARIIAMTETSPETHAILVPPGSGIDSIEDLQGLTVGGFSSALAPFLALMLANADLPGDYIDYIQVPPDAGLAALTSGAIDAWYTWDPFYAQAQLEDLADVVVDGTDFFLNPIVIVAREDYIEENPEAVQAFLTGYDASVTWVNENPADAAAYMAEATGMSPEAADITIERRDYALTIPTESDIAWMDSLGEALVEAGTLPDVPDLNVAIDTTALEGVLGD